MRQQREERESIRRASARQRILSPVTNPMAILAQTSAFFTVDHVWLAIGFLGQFLFASRFLIQWFKSELVGRSVIPVAFWYFSLGGGIVLLAYAVHKVDPVFITGQGMGLFVYARNLYLISRERRNDTTLAPQKL
jgi:lipid-A-disaccharide synthase-like uncharacterized protein